jgi:hypothetical protein
MLVVTYFTLHRFVCRGVYILLGRSRPIHGPDRTRVAQRLVPLKGQQSGPYCAAAAVAGVIAYR